MNVLICIGCNEYNDRESFPPLEGAETDASRLFDALTQPPAIYASARSALRQSPTLQDVVETLTRVLFDGPPIETLTFFFAGHACVAQGSLHLVVKDTLADRLSVTAFAIARIFEMIAEAKPRVANVVIDACQAAGSHYDLHALLKPEVLGRHQGSSVVFFGACMADQYALENARGGIATNCLLRFVSGETRLQDARPTLDLVELGQAVAKSVSAASQGVQSPACWAVALAGYGVFGPNPHYRPEGSHPPYPVESVSPTSPAGRAVAKHSEQLWEEHRRLNTDWSPRRTNELIRSVVSEFGGDLAELSSFLRGISKSLRLRTVEAQDLLADSDVAALVGIQLLPYLGSASGQAIAREFLDECVLASEEAANALTADLRGNRFALLEGGLGEFHYLPLKVSKILGWLGAHQLVREALGCQPHSAYWECAIELLRHYSHSAVSVSEVQAPGVYLMLAGLSRHIPRDLTKEVVARYLASAVASGGHFLSIDATPQDIVAYTAIRSGVEMPIDPSGIARPTELLSVLLQAASAIGLDGFDLAMHNLDRAWINSFVPTDYTDFGAPTIREGVNFHQRIGFGVWTLADIECAFSAKVRAHACSAIDGLPQEGQALCLLASHLFEDRVPYFAAVV